MSVNADSVLLKVASNRAVDDLGAWRVPDFRMSQHIERYKQKHEASEPKEDFEDRTLLYSL